MSSKEALDLDGSKTRKCRARKAAGSVWESRIMVKTGTQLSHTHHITQQNTDCATTMSNAEIQVDKKVVKSTPKQSPTAKSKTVEIARQRSDLGIKKTPPQIKRTRSAVASATVGDEVDSVKLRKLKSDSARVVDRDETVAAHLGINKLRIEGDEILPPPDVEEEEEEKEIEVEVEKKSIEIKDIVVSLQEEKPKKVLIEEETILSNDRSPPVTVSPIVEKIAPPARIEAKLNPISDHGHGTSSRLQSFTDLIMWRDASRSAFVFGIGAFAIISSSYTKDLNISCISVLSYLGLVYLALSFIFRSLIRRGNIDMDSRDEEYVVGEEEAVWLIKLVLPYVNEFLSKLRSLFSGDPATTMKLAVVLFVLARCGGSITIWKMTKLGFFGVFMVPKLCYSYSSHLAAYGTFWIRRFGDAWESCSHKKAVAFGILSLVWNLSSVIARIWAIFVLFVAFRYYQQCRIKEEEGLQEEVVESQYSGKAQKSNIIDIKKQNKV